jgi:uncharacterized membrane protein YtjA (UPF0391 family)
MALRGPLLATGWIDGRAGACGERATGESVWRAGFRGGIWQNRKRFPGGEAWTSDWHEACEVNEERLGCRPSRHPGARKKGARTMLQYSVVFLIVALVAAFLGFGSLAGMAATIAKILFIVFLVLAAFSFLTGRRGPTTLP